MSNYSNNNSRIAKNTIMLYGRMLFGMLVSLYTSRVILNTLGVVDYGILNVVGSVVVLFSLISGSLSSAVSRFMTFELGKGDMEQLKRVFSTSLLIHLMLAAIIFVLMESVGLWFLNTHMEIPDGRMFAANCVFQAAIFSFMIGLWSVPYNALIVSHEHMSTYARIGVLETLLKLGIVLLIANISWLPDRLITYSILLTSVGICMQLIYIGYCKRHFLESQFQMNFDKHCWKEMSAFAGWNFIGVSSAVLREQGGNILLNIFGGPAINAAKGIASQVNSAVGSFSYNLMAAVNPQITKNYAPLYF